MFESFKIIDFGQNLQKWVPGDTYKLLTLLRIIHYMYVKFKYTVTDANSNDTWENET